MTNEPQQRVFIVDHSPARLQKLRTLMESVKLVAETYRTPGEFLQNRDVHHCGCLILGLRLPQMSGLELYRRLRKQEDMIPAIFFTEHGDVPTAVAAMREGAFDFLEASTSEQRLLDCVSAALQRDREIRAETAEHKTASARIAQLSPKERAILDLLIAGKPSKNIAQELGITCKTVDFHRANILKKVNVDSVTRLIYLCFTVGLAGSDCHRRQPEPTIASATSWQNALAVNRGIDAMQQVL